MGERIVLAKVGLDGHDRGIKVVARVLRDAGFEIVYIGLGNSPEQVVRTAVQEDAAAIGLSVLSGAHMTLFPAVVRLLGEAEVRDILVFGGGVVPDADIATLESEGVSKIFTPGASLAGIVTWAEQNIRRAGNRS